MIGKQKCKERGIDRIKRSVLKKDYCEGGLNVTDVDCLNRAVMLLLVKCYDKKGVVTLQLGHPYFDLASGGYPTKKNNDSGTRLVTATRAGVETG